MRRSAADMQAPSPPHSYSQVNSDSLNWQKVNHFAAPSYFRPSAEARLSRHYVHTWGFDVAREAAVLTQVHYTRQLAQFVGWSSDSSRHYSQLSRDLLGTLQRLSLAERRETARRAVRPPCEKQLELSLQRYLHGSKVTNSLHFVTF